MSSDINYSMEPDYGGTSLLPIPEYEDAYASRHRNLYLLIVLAGIITSIAIYISSREASWEHATAVGLVFGLMVCIAHVVWRLRLRPRNYLAPDVLYILFYAAFHFAFLILWLFGIVGATDPVSAGVFVAPEQYPFVMLIVNLGLLSFLFGYELAAPRRKTNIPTRFRTIPTPIWSVAGLILMLLALIIHVAFIFGVGVRTFMARGYEVYIYMERFSSYYRLWRVQFLIFALGFGIYITSVALRYGRLFRGKFGVILFLIYLCLLAFEGARTRMVAHGMILLTVRHFVIKPIKLKSLLVIIILALFAFSSIGLVRNTAAFNVPEMIKMIREAHKTGQSHWYDSLAEMGSSINTVNLTAIAVPELEPYWHGRSYLQAIAHIFPYMSTITAPYLGLVPSQWVTITRFGYFAAGRGYSIAAEGYLNFGLPGVFFHMMFLGVLFRRIYARFATSVSPVSTLTFIVTYGLFMITVRNHVNLLIAPLVQTIVGIWLLKNLFGEEVVQVGYEEPVLYEQQDYEGALTYG